MNRLSQWMSILCLFSFARCIYAQPAPQQRRGLNFGTFSNLRNMAYTGDVLGIEVTIVPQYKTAYAIFQCGEGTPSDPVFVPIELKGNHFRFVIRSGDKSCDGIFTGTISVKGMTLRAQNETTNQEAYNAGGFIPRRRSYWSQ